MTNLEELRALLERAQGLADDTVEERERDEYEGPSLMLAERARALSEDIAAALTPPKPEATEAAKGAECTCGHEYVEGIPVGPSGDPNCPEHRDVMHAPPAKGDAP